MAAPASDARASLQISVAGRVVDGLVLSGIVVRLLVRMRGIVVLMLRLLLLVIGGIVIILLGVRVRVLIVHVLVVNAGSTVSGYAGREIVLGDPFNASGMVEFRHQLLPLTVGISVRGGAL